MEQITTFSVRLQELLDQTGMTQAELASLSGVSAASISHYLKGDWVGKQDAVFALAEAANVNAAWLLGYDVPMERRKHPAEMGYGTESYEIVKAIQRSLIGVIFPNDAKALQLFEVYERTKGALEADDMDDITDFIQDRADTNSGAAVTED